MRKLGYAARSIAAVVAATCLAAVPPSYGQAPPPVIDILVLYTATAELEFQRRDRAIEKEIAFVAHMQNRIFESSGVQAQVKVTAKLWPEFKEATDIKADWQCNPVELNCVVTCPGGPGSCQGVNFQTDLLKEIDEATAAADKYSISKHRKQANADLVSLWMWRGGWDTAGSAASPLLAQSDFDLGAAVVSKTRYLSLIVAEKAWLWWHFAHEIGHNLGLAHEKQSGSSATARAMSIRSSHSAPSWPRTASAIPRVLPPACASRSTRTRIRASPTSVIRSARREKATQRRP